MQCVAENLGAGVATIHRIETLFDETGSDGKRKYLDCHGTHQMTARAPRAPYMAFQGMQNLT